MRRPWRCGGLWSSSRARLPTGDAAQTGKTTVATRILNWRPLASPESWREGRGGVKVEGCGKRRVMWWRFEEGCGGRVWEAAGVVVEEGVLKDTGDTNKPEKSLTIY